MHLGCANRRATRAIRSTTSARMAQLDLDYNTVQYPIHREQMNITNVATAKTLGATYGYTENADGSGQLTFDWTVDVVPGVPGATDVKFISRWLGSGRGRADAYLSNGNVAVGTDCWASTQSPTTSGAGMARAI